MQFYHGTQNKWSVSLDFLGYAMGVSGCVCLCAHQGHHLSKKSSSQLFSSAGGPTPLGSVYMGGGSTISLAGAWGQRKVRAGGSSGGNATDRRGGAGFPMPKQR